MLIGPLRFAFLVAFFRGLIHNPKDGEVSKRQWVKTLNISKHTSRPVLPGTATVSLKTDAAKHLPNDKPISVQQYVSVKYASFLL